MSREGFAATPHLALMGGPWNEAGHWLWSTASDPLLWIEVLESETAPRLQLLDGNQAALDRLGCSDLPALQRTFSQAFAEPGQSHWLAHAMQQRDVAFAWRYPTADGGEWRELQCRAHRFQVGGSTLLLMRCIGPDELDRYRQEADRQAERYQMLFQGSLDAVVSLIRDFQLAELKVDKSYVDAIEASRQNRSIVKAMVELAEAESIRLVAEGVETESQFAALKQLGVPRFQGYLFAKPLSAEAFKALLLQQQGRSLDS